MLMRFQSFKAGVFVEVDDSGVPVVVALLPMYEVGLNQVLINAQYLREEFYLFVAVCNLSC